MVIFRYIIGHIRLRYFIRTQVSRDDVLDIGSRGSERGQVCHVVAFYSISPRLDALTISFRTGQRHSFFTTSLYNGPAHIKEQLCSYQRCAVQATHHYGAITVSVQLGCPHLCIYAMLLSAVFRLNQTFLPIRLGSPIKDPVLLTTMLAIDYLNIHALSESGTTNSCHLAAGRGNVFPLELIPFLSPVQLKLCSKGATPYDRSSLRYIHCTAALYHCTVLSKTIYTQDHARRQLRPHSCSNAQLQPHSCSNWQLDWPPRRNSNCQPRGEVPEVQPRGEAPEVLPRRAAPEVLPRGAAPEVLPRRAAPEVLPRGAAPEVLPRDAAPEVLPRDAAPEVLPRDAAPEVPGAAYTCGSGGTP